MARSNAGALLRALRNGDGGFGMRAGSPSEAEPTALAALALGDDRARDWLRREQRRDGGFGIATGSLVNDATTGLAALALGPSLEADRALDRLERSRAEFHVSTSAIPIDPDAIGWSWTAGSASWTEPTARALLALRLIRPDSTAIQDAVALLRDREAVGGGWNYGNRVVLAEELPPFAQTTAMALIGLRGFDQELEGRGVRRLRSLWRAEAAGGLTVATAFVALHLHGEREEATKAEKALDVLVRDTGLLGDGVALGWAALAESRVWESWERR
jgi:Prenyltransferase and squalene oxidase repeat